LELWKLESSHLSNLPNHKSSSMISPSLVGHCVRQNVFDMLQYPKPPIKPQSLLVMHRGTTIHEDIQGMWRDMGILVAEELVMNHESKNLWTKQKCTELRVNGRLDAILRIAPLLYVAEIKTAKNSSFNRMVKDGPYEAYVYQLMLYMYLTQIKKGFLYVENKDTQEHYQFDYDYDEEIIAKLLNHINTINHHVLSLTLPPQDLRSPSFQCKNLCDYCQICWSSAPERYIKDHREEIRALVQSQTFFDYNENMERTISLSNPTSKVDVA
jgi:hypothetical protein